MKRKRLPVDQFVWDIFVKACGARCSVCGEENKPLERGHRIAFASDGAESLDNLLPVCRPCNQKYHRQEETPDRYRPADYLERFYILLGQALRPKISCFTENGSCYTIPSNYPVENKTLISWNTAENSVLKALYTRSSDTMTRAEADNEIGRLISFSRSKEPPPELPLAATRAELVQLAMKHGSRFKIAARAFIADKPWLVPGSESLTHHRAWAQFTANFEHFLNLGEQARLADKQRKERERVARRQERWAAFKRVATCTDWPGMTDDDHRFIAAVSSEVEREVTDAELERAAGIHLREYTAKRQVVADRLALFERMIASKNLDYNLRRLRAAFGKAASVRELTVIHKQLTEFYDETLRCELGPISDELLGAW